VTTYRCPDCNADLDITYQGIGTCLNGHEAPMAAWVNVNSNGAVADGDASASDAEASATTPSTAATTQATRLVEIACNGDLDFLVTDDGEVFAGIAINGHRETHRLHERGFRHWLALKYFDASGVVPSGQGLRDATAYLDALGHSHGTHAPVAVRLGAVGDTRYLDLGDPAWTVVEIDGTGWRVMASTDCPIYFRRPRGMAALPVPERGGNLTDLATFLRLNEPDLILVLGWLIGVFAHAGGRAILQLLGEQGSGKSVAARMLTALVDPCQSPLRSPPRHEEDLLIAAGNRAVVAIDNMGVVPDWLSDVLCRLSTGGGLSKRALYTDADEFVIDAQRPLVLTSITSPAANADLLDRTITVTLPPPTAWQPERNVLAAFLEARPRLLGALLDAVAAALAHRATVTVDGLPRLADVAQFVEGARTAVGWSEGDFLRLLRVNRALTDAVAIESAVIGPVVVSFMDRRESWEGTSSALLAELSTLVPEPQRLAKAWPKQPNVLSHQLTRLTPNLRRFGIEVTFTRTSHGRMITLAKNEEPPPDDEVCKRPSSSSSSSPTHKNRPTDDDPMTVHDNFASENDDHRGPDYARNDGHVGDDGLLQPCASRALDDDADDVDAVFDVCCLCGGPLPEGAAYFCAGRN
jgi:hypothetical protein